MSKIRFSNQFKQRYKRRISKNPKLVKDFFEALEIFETVKNSRAINDHQLNRKMYKYRAFSVNDDYRVTYLEKDDHYLFVDIGTHEQVYQK